MPLPSQVTAIYRAVKELEARYPTRKFTPDGHLVGSIGEVVAAEALGLQLHTMSYAGHDAFDEKGNVQIKMTAGKHVAMYSTCERLVVLRVVSPEVAEIVYDGPGGTSVGASAKDGEERSTGCEFGKTSCSRPRIASSRDLTTYVLNVSPKTLTAVVCEHRIIRHRKLDAF